MVIKRDRINRTLSIDQSLYLSNVLKRFQMENCCAVSTPLETGRKFCKRNDDEAFDIKLYQQAIGCLNYICNTTRPDISAAVGVLSQFVTDPSVDHWTGVKRILRYLKGTLDYGLIFGDDGRNLLVGFSDADWAGDIDSRRSTSGYIFKLGNCLISWCSRKQATVAKSTTEAEYVSLSIAAQEAIWL